jgi:hypothetical protein
VLIATTHQVLAAQAAVVPEVETIQLQLRAVLIRAAAVVVAAQQQDLHPMVRAVQAVPASSLSPTQPAQ